MTLITMRDAVLFLALIAAQSALGQQGRSDEEIAMQEFGLRDRARLQGPWNRAATRWKAEVSRDEILRHAVLIQFKDNAVSGLNLLGCMAHYSDDFGQKYQTALTLCVVDVKAGHKYE